MSTYSIIDQVRLHLNYDRPVSEMVSQIEDKSETPRLIEDFLYWNGVSTNWAGALSMAVIDQEGNILDSDEVEDVFNLTETDIASMERLIKVGRVEVNKMVEQTRARIHQRVEDVLNKQAFNDADGSFLE